MTPTPMTPLTTYPDTTLAPVARACRDVIGAAAGVTALLLGELTAPGEDPAADPLAELYATNPALAAALSPMLDAVMELDDRTGFLEAVA